MNKPRRIKKRILIARWNGAAEYEPVEVDAYVPSPESRFAVHRMHHDPGRWTITHIASGMCVGSIVLGVDTLTRGLQIIGNWESKGMDMSVLDETTFGRGFNKRPDPRIRTLIDFMRKESVA